MHSCTAAIGLYQGCTTFSQRRIFIFGALGYFKLGGALLEGWCGRSHIFQLHSCSKLFETGSGSKKFSSLRIRLLFMLWQPLMQLKFSNVFT